MVKAVSTIRDAKRKANISMKVPATFSKAAGRYQLKKIETKATINIMKYVELVKIRSGTAHE